MSKLVKFEWHISRLFVYSSEVSDGKPNQIKLTKAIELLRAAKLCSKLKEVKKLENQAWDALLPMQLEVNYSDGDLFDSGGQTIVEINDRNSSWRVWTEEESVGVNLSVSFEMKAVKDVTDKSFDDWECQYGWDWIGVSIASEGYEIDNGSSMAHSFVDA